MKTRRGDEIRGDGEEKRKRANNECGNHTKGRVSGSEGRVERGRIFSVLVSLEGCVIRRDAGWRIRWQNKSCLSSHLTSPSTTGPGWRECASESGWPGPIAGRAAKTSVSVPAYSSVFLETSIMQAICL